MRSLAPLLLLAVACTPEEEPRDYSAYVPFDEAHMTNQLARLQAHADIQAARKEATLDNAADVFADIETLYQSSDLQLKVAGRTDDHLEIEGWGFPEVGTFLDTHITDAIALGKSPADEADVAYAGQVVDKALLVFFYYSVYHEIVAGHRKNLDEAYGYWGLELDGTPRNGLANIAAGREDEFGLVLNRPIFESFVDARYVMAENTESTEDALPEGLTEYEAAREEIDARMIQTLAGYALHELNELGGDEDDVKLLEARVIWEGVAPYAENADPALATEIWTGLYPDGRLERTAEGYFLAGLDDIRSGTTVVDGAALRQDVGAILESLD